MVFCRYCSQNESLERARTHGRSSGVRARTTPRRTPGCQGIAYPAMTVSPSTHYQEIDPSDKCALPYLFGCSRTFLVGSRLKERRKYRVLTVGKLPEDNVRANARRNKEVVVAKTNLGICWWLIGELVDFFCFSHHFLFASYECHDGSNHCKGSHMNTFGVMVHYRSWYSLTNLHTT